MVIRLISTISSAADSRVEPIVKMIESFGAIAKPEEVGGTNSTYVHVLVLDNTETGARGCSLPDYPFRQLDSVESVERVSVPNISLRGNGQHHVEIGGDTLGLGLPCVPVMGQCASDTNIYRTFERLAKHGIRHARGCGRKPRSNAYSFRGYGKKGWLWALEAAKASGMRSYWTEVCESGDIDIVRRIREEVRFEGDLVLWVGASGVWNYRVLEALGNCRDAIAMVKHSPFMSNVKQFIARAEFVVNGPMYYQEDGAIDVERSLPTGNDRLMLCVRGLENRDEHARRRFYANVDWIHALHTQVWTPIVWDPSHPAGKREIVAQTLTEGMAHHPEAVMIEAHCDPSKGQCDDINQSVTMDQVPELLEIIAQSNALLEPKQLEVA